MSDPSRTWHAPNTQKQTGVTMKKFAYIAVAFASAVLATGCMSVEERVAEQNAEVKKHEQQDAVLFRQAGLEIVTRTGLGLCNAQGEIKESGYFLGGSDQTYILKKPGSDGLYTACVIHHQNPRWPTIRGLRAVDNAPVK